MLPSPFQDMVHKETDIISLLFWSKHTHMLLGTTSSESWLFLVLLIVQNAERINFWALWNPLGKHHMGILLVDKMISRNSYWTFILHDK